MTESGYEIIIGENHSKDTVQTLKTDRSIFAISLSGVELKAEATDPAEALDELTISHGFAERLLAKKWLRTAIFHKGEEEYWKLEAIKECELNHHNRKAMRHRENGYAVLFCATLISSYGYWFSMWTFFATGVLLSIISFVVFNRYKIRTSIHE